VKNLRATTIAGALTLAGVAGLVALSSQNTDAREIRNSAQNADAPRLGVVDLNQAYSAYPGQQRFNQEMQKLQQEFAQAQQTGNRQKLTELQQRAQQMQQDLATKFESDINKVARQVAKNNNVEILVSDVIYQADAVTEVDLTDEIVDAMNGDAGDGEGDGEGDGGE